jgi:hypothetical protein
MPDTPGKRQRREVKAKRRQAKDERRAARNERREDPSIVAPWMEPSYGEGLDESPVGTQETDEEESADSERQ